MKNTTPSPTCRMSGPGITTLLVLLLGAAGFLISARVGKSTGYGAPGNEAEASVRAVHRQVAERLRREGEVEAAEWHQRIADGKAIELRQPPGAEGDDGSATFTRTVTPVTEAADRAITATRRQLARDR